MGIVRAKGSRKRVIRGRWHRAVVSGESMAGITEKLTVGYCSLSLWRVVRGSKLMRLDHLIHGLYIT